MRYFILLVAMLVVAGCVSTSTFQPIKVTNARADGAYHYYASPASCATIHWNLAGLDNIYVSDPNGKVLGPFSASGELRTIPLHAGMVYYIYRPGRVGALSGTTLHFDTPASLEYPGNQNIGYMDASCQ